MKIGSSKIIREQGESQAFDHGAWEFRSRQFCSSAKQLLQIYDAQLAAPSFESIMCLPTAVFLLSLAIEQVCKAYYLKSGARPREKIYNHEVASLCGDKLLNPEQRDLMTYAKRFVVWAGRYPTPKWTNETFKEAYDVPSVFIDGTEHIDASKIPNAASRERANQLLALYEHIRIAWEQMKDA